MAATSAKKLVGDLAGVRASDVALDQERSRQLVTEALRSLNAQAVIQAAQLITESKASGFGHELHTAYRALSGERASSLDAGCAAKEALLTALDTIEDAEEELFAVAALYRQVERGKGGPRDSAAGVRARGVLGLARLGHPELLCIFGMCLADREPSVRLATARAIVHRGHRAGAGLLLVRVGAGDDVPEVLMECARGLFALAPDFARRHAAQILHDGDEQEREQMLHVLGTAADDSAIALLAEQLASTSLSEQRKPIIESLGLSLRTSARTLLLELIASDRGSDAEAALEALAIHRYDQRLVAQVRELAAASPQTARMFKERFES